jgi:hypothetical protein
MKIIPDGAKEAPSFIANTRKSGSAGGERYRRTATGFFQRSRQTQGVEVLGKFSCAHNRMGHQKRQKHNRLQPGNACVHFCSFLLTCGVSIVVISGSQLLIFQFDLDQRGHDP